LTLLQRLIASSATWPEPESSGSSGPVHSVRTAGIYGRWVKIKLYFSLFPLYKSATFARQKSYMKSERLR
jgi:hypothetical protein